MQRRDMVIRLRPERAEQYLHLHAEPWPDVLDILHVRNYSIFLHAGLLFGYLEYHGDDWTADSARIAADPVTQQWWALTVPCQECLGTAPDGEWWAPMNPVFFMP